MSRSSRFRPARTVETDSTTVEIGRRSGGLAYRITLPGSTVIIIDAATADDLADALDDAIDCVETDPLLWVV